MAGISRSDLLNALRVQAAMATGRSPLVAALLRAHARALEAPGPAPLGAAVLAALAERRLAHPWEAPLLCAAAVHHLVLGPASLGPRSGAVLERLRALHPSAGGRFDGSPEAEAALGRALRALGRLQLPGWRAFLKMGKIYPNVDPGRALCWLEPARALASRRPLPLCLLELGAGAGQLLVGDLLLPGAGLEVSGRVGVDPQPLDVRQPEAVRALRACVWADQDGRLQRLDAAVERLLGLARQGAAPLLLAGEPAERLGEAAARLREGGAGPRRLLLYSAAASPRLDDEAHDRLWPRAAGVLAGWPGPALWIELGPARRSAGLAMQLTARRLSGGALEEIPLGSARPDPEEPWALDRAGLARLLEE